MTPKLRPAAGPPPLPVETPYSLAAASELLGYTVGYVKKLLCVHRDQFAPARYRRGRRLRAFRVRWLTAEEIRLLQHLSALKRNAGKRS